MSLEPTTVVSWDLFRDTSIPYLEVRRPFILGGQSTWKPTLFHFFTRILHDKGILTRNYTQNIDALDYKVGVPNEKIISVHGTMGKAACEICGAETDIQEFRDAVRKQIKDIYGAEDPAAPSTSTPIVCWSCKAPKVKPATVLYGRNLPKEFFENSKGDAISSTLVLVAGTSLTVNPAAGLPDLAPAPIPRFVINRELTTGNTNIDPTSDRDGVILGDCDSAVCDILEACGEDWLTEMMQYKDDMCSRSRDLLLSRVEEITKG